MSFFSHISFSIAGHDFLDNVRGTLEDVEIVDLTGVHERDAEANGCVSEMDSFVLVLEAVAAGR